MNDGLSVGNDVQKFILNVRTLCHLQYFLCSSASYDTNRKECYLSPDDRYTKPRAFQSNPIYDYIENQCSPIGR